MYQIHFRFCSHRWQGTRSYVLTQHYSDVFYCLSVVYGGRESTSYQRNRPLKCDHCLSIESDIILNNVSICNKNTHVTNIKMLILIFSVNYNFLARRTIRET
jgi:hypothetical protein